MRRSAATPPGRSTWSPGRARTASRAPPTSSSATARSTRATPSRRSDEPAPDYNRNQFGGSLGGPHRREPRCSSSPTTRARGCARGSRASPTCRRWRSGTGDFSQSLFAPPRRSVLAASRFRAARSRRSSISPIGAAIAALYPAAQPQHAVRELRRRRRPSTDDIDQFDVRHRSRARRRVAADGALQLQRPPAVRAVCRHRLLDRARIRQRRRRARPEPRRWPTTGRSASSLVNDVRFGYNRVAIGVFAENPQIDNALGRAEGAGDQSARRRAEPDLHRRLLAARPRVQQPAGEHVRHVSDCATPRRGRAARTSSRSAASGTACGSRPTATCRRAAS